MKIANLRDGRRTFLFFLQIAGGATPEMQQAAANLRPAAFNMSST
jgi:hypothetical protein